MLILHFRPRPHPRRDRDRDSGCRHYHDLILPSPYNVRAAHESTPRRM